MNTVEFERKKFFNKASLIVVKVGTAVLVSRSGRVEKNKIRHVAKEVFEILRQGKKAVLVTSGAIGAGMKELDLDERPRDIPGEQACAAVGQVQIMRAYSEAFQRLGYKSAQILLTQGDLRDRTRYLNAKNTITELLGHRVVPIINENDTVAVDELYFGEKFGDNDTLSGLVTNLIDADALILLSDVDGLHKSDFSSRRSLRHGKVINVVKDISSEAERNIRKSKTQVTKGGMVTKIRAAKVVTSSGKVMVIANGKKEGIIKRILSGEEVGTIFLPKADKINARKQWIAFTLHSKGKLVIDKGACSALKGKGKSLLPIGMKDLSGNFNIGDLVDICCEGEEKEFAKGLVNYSSKELSKIVGIKTEDIESVLGYKYYDEVIHRDNLVIL